MATVIDDDVVGVTSAPCTERPREPQKVTMDESSLSADYAPIAALMKQFDEQICTFADMTEKIAHESAPAYVNLIQRWTLEADLLSSSGGGEVSDKKPPASSHEKRDDDEPTSL